MDNVQKRNIYSIDSVRIIYGFAKCRDITFVKAKFERMYWIQYKTRCLLLWAEVRHYWRKALEIFHMILNYFQ
jgi:hypothetical protein